jgi:hypothetical protein
MPTFHCIRLCNDFERIFCLVENDTSESNETRIFALSNFSYVGRHVEGATAGDAPVITAPCKSAFTSLGCIPWEGGMRFAVGGTPLSGGGLSPKSSDM